MKLFLDIILCIIMVVLLIGILDQIVKLTKETMTMMNAMTPVTGKVNPDLTYQHRLVILVTETVVLVILRWVVLKL